MLMVGWFMRTRFLTSIVARSSRKALRCIARSLRGWPLPPAWTDNDFICSITCASCASNAFPTILIADFEVAGFSDDVLTDSFTTPVSSESPSSSSSAAPAVKERKFVTSYNNAIASPEAVRTARSSPFSNLDKTGRHLISKPATTPNVKWQSSTTTWRLRFQNSNRNWKFVCNSGMRSIALREEEMFFLTSEHAVKKRLVLGQV